MVKYQLLLTELHFITKRDTEIIFYLKKNSIIITNIRKINQENIKIQGYQSSVFFF